jgi:hypothetical protein
MDVVRRGRARLLQAAAEMREQKKVAPALPFWRRNGVFGARFTRLAISSLAMITFLLTGGTGLVNASNGALPGDKLYPVKRSWEDVRLVFVIDKNAKEALEHEFDHERVQEIEELYSAKRIAEVNFQGVVQQLNDKTWVIDGLNIKIEDQTLFSGDILPGAMVQVIGETDDGHIKAQRIILLATPGVTPSPTAKPTLVLSPDPSATTESGNSEEENNNWYSSTPVPTSTPDGSRIEGESTPRNEGGGNEGGGEDGGGNSHPTATGEHHEGGGEEHTPQPTEQHNHESTPHPTEHH